MFWVLLIILIILLLAMAAGFFICNSVFLYNDQNKGDYDSALDPDSIDAETDLMRPTAARYYAFRRPMIEKMDKLKFKELSILSFDDLTLYGYLYEGNPKEVVICVHGYNCNGPDECSHILKFYRNVRGYNYFLTDLRGHGRSEGNRIGFGYLDSKDILNWIDYLIKRFGEDIEILLYGISMGAATVMTVNESNPPEQVKLVIEDCGFTNAYEEMVNTVKDKLGMNLPFLVSLGNIWCRLLAGYDLKKDADPLGKMKYAKNPVLFIHGDADTFVPTYMCHKLYDACPTAKDKLIVPGAVHAFSYYDAKEEYEKKVSEFIDANLK